MSAWWTTNSHTHCVHRQADRFVLLVRLFVHLYIHYLEVHLRQCLHLFYLLCSADRHRMTQRWTNAAKWSETSAKHFSISSMEIISQGLREPHKLSNI